MLLAILLSGAIVTAAPGATVLLPEHPIQCEEYILRHDKGDSVVTVIASHLILGYRVVFLQMPNQVLDVQFRDGEWRDPIHDCQGTPT
jgi:hypothetical protein